MLRSCCIAYHTVMGLVVVDTIKILTNREWWQVERKDYDRVYDPRETANIW